MRFRRKFLSIVGIAAAVAFSVGGLSLAYGFPIPNDPGGHEHTLRTLLPEDCGTYLSGAEDTGQQIDPDSYAFSGPSPLGDKAGNSVDLNWVHDVSTDTDFIVWDMGRKVDKVDVFPLIDHPPVPEESLEFTVWASADPNPPFTSPKWTVGNIARIFDHGWNLEWIADDFVSRWRFPHRYQYIAIQWGGPRAMIADGDTEIDAVCVPRTEDD
jgi:hypothetical protein